SSTRINGAVGFEGDVVSFASTPDGALALYVADQTQDDDEEIYVADFSGAEVRFAGVTVTLSTPALLAATVQYRVIGGTATGDGIGADYRLANDTLTFQPG